MAQAPYRLRPDTTHWGSLFGPFDGQVVDAASGNPISGALVIGSWSYESESGPAVPVSAYSTNATTNNDGAYSLPELPTNQRSQAMLRRFTLIVYKAGYVGYRSDLRWDDRSRRFDFAQLANKVRLERVPAGESKAHILTFLGGGQALLRAAQAEVIQAALELGERSPELPSAKSDAELASASKQATAQRLATRGPETLAEKLLTLADISAAAPGSPAPIYGSEVLATSLPASDPKSAGIADISEYSGVHYRAKDLPESHDVALRAWRTASGADAETVWKKLQVQLQAPELRDASGKTPTIPVPPERAAQPLLPEVPAMFPPLRDAEGGARVLLPHAPPKEAAAGVKREPLKIDASQGVYDNKQRTYGVAVLVRRLGLVLELLCGADLCHGEEAAHGLLTRALSRL